MPTNGQQKGTRKSDTIWRLRVSPEIVRKVEKLATDNRRSVTKQAQVIIEKAIEQGIS